MRIIAGKYKNIKLSAAIKDKVISYRPTTSKVREAVFNILAHSPLWDSAALQNAKVLDLFCGGGAYGIEALSRGASHATFVNNNRGEMVVVKKNIESLKDESKSTEFLTCDATNIHSLGNCYDIIFIDPPYKSNLITKCLAQIGESILVAQNHIIIIETAAQEVVIPPNSVLVLETKKYGASAIHIAKFKFEE